VVRAAGQHLALQSGFVCEDGSERTTPGGEPLRYDGVHYSAAGTAAFWTWLLPILREVADPPAVGAREGSTRSVPSAA
jgi:hypothetical protein